MGENRPRVSPFAMAQALENAAALLRAPAIQAAMDILDDMADADRAHGRTQALRRQQAETLASEAALPLAALERLRTIRPVLQALVGGQTHA